MEDRQVLTRRAPVDPVAIASGVRLALARLLAEETLSADAKNVLASASALLGQIAAQVEISGLRQAGSEIDRQTRERASELLAELGVAKDARDPLVQLASVDPGRIPARAQNMRSEILERVVDFENALTNTLKQLNAPLGGGSDAVVKIDASVLLNFLHRVAPELRISGIERISQIPGGFSKRTFLFSALDDGGVRAEFVIRMEGPRRKTTTVMREYAVLRRLFEENYLVPKPLLVEPDADELGAPFLLFPRVMGENFGNVVGLTRPVTAEIVEQMAAALARLHRLDHEPLHDALQYRGDMRESMRQRIADNRSDWLKEDPAPQPALEMLYGWLDNNIPEDLTPCLIHGDFGLHNILIDKGELTAILDWERSRIGDPMEDLACCKPFLGDVMTWDDFVACYEKAGGLYRAEAAAYFDVWRSAWRAAACLTLGARFQHAPFETPLSSGFTGTFYGPHFLAEAARSLVAAEQNARNRRGAA
jgi:aminoglycoside phosphotransferase (APT) family kinase protein